MAASLCLFWVGGCKSGSSANVITVSISSSVGTTLILGQSTTLTATVTGATNTNVNWQPCQFTTTTTSGTTTTTSKPTACPTDGTLGTLSNEQTTGTATFTAPTTLPSQTTYPGLLVVITAQSAQTTSKTGSISLAIDSGISVNFTPTTATVPTKEQQQFNPVLSNDLKNQGVTWLVTQATPTSTTPYPKLASCSVAGDATGCGSIDANGLYSAPAVVPTSTTLTSTPANVTVVATAVGDTTRFAIGTITIIAGGPITFNGISPHSAPQGAAFWDIFLDSPNISSASKITLTYSDGTTKTKTSDLGQTKVLFPIPTSTTTSPPSSGARLRLKDTDLLGTGTVTVSVTDSGQMVTTPNLALHPEFYAFDLKAVRPTSVSSVPDSVVQGADIGSKRVVVDGGYFGPGAQSLAKVFFQGNEIPKDPNPHDPSSARQLNLAFRPGTVNSSNPGLYPLSVAYTGTAMPPPSPNNPSITSLAIFPDYSVNPPLLLTSPVPAGSNPSAIDIDPTLGVVVVAETGSNAVQFYKIVPPTLSSPETLAPIDSSGANCVNSCPVSVGKVPTGLSVNRNDHTVAVVNYQDQSVTVLPIPVPGAAQQNPAPGTPFTVDISGAFQGAFQGSSSAIPFPYAIGVDSDTKLALVAYSSTATSSNINVGFIVNLNLDQNGNPFGCPLITTTKTGQCLYAQVTLNTGTYPQIAMAPHGHLALVSPGGSGIVQGVDLTKASTSTSIAGASLTAGTVTITTSMSHKLIPGNSGTVLITGVTKGANGTDFNGVYTVAATSDTTFIYTLNSTVSDTGTGGTVFYSNPNLNFFISSTNQGIAINPITRTAALADANSIGTNGPQIDLLDSLDQSVSSITFHADCTAFTTNCTNAPELLGTTNVAWQPYSNALVSYNPQQKQVSVSDPVSQQRYAIVRNLGPSAISSPVTNGTTNAITLWGGIAVDPATNHAFVVESGQAAMSSTTPPTPAKPGQIEIINLGPDPSNNLKSTQITELVVPSPAPGPNSLGGIPNALVPQATLTCTTPVPPATTCDLPGVRIFGSGFGAVGNTTTQVRLDGTAINGLCSPPNPAACVNVISDREIDVTIPASIPTGDPNNPALKVLELPHRYALDVSNGSVQSNATDLLVVKALDLSKVCPGTNPQPNSVAIADQIASGPFSPIAIVSNSGCNSISIIDVKPTMTVTVNGQVETVANPNFGTVQNTVSVGTTPRGIAISQRYGVAVVANNGTNNASIIDLTKNPPAPFAASPVATGTGPAGVAINEATGAAIVANTGSNTISEINLSLLFPATGTPPTTLTATSIGGIQEPIAVAIDPDRGTNNLGIAVVTSVQLVSGAVPNGAVTVVEIGSATPSISTTAAVGSVGVTPSGIIFDPAAVTNTANPGLFYTNSSGSNVITAFNPDSGTPSSVSVGINPTSLALNPQTGAILTTNSSSNTISIVDTLSNPLRTRQTLGIPGSQQFGVAIDQFTNLAVIVDQANNRVLLFPMPN